MASTKTPAFVEPQAGDEDFALPVFDLGRSEVRMVPVSKLEIDPKMQRDHLDVRKIERILRDYNPDALGIITASERNAAETVILDGAHRHRATVENTEGQGTLLTRVFKGLTRREEAVLFLLLNSGNQPNLLDKFRINLVAEDPVAVGIDNIVKQFGLGIGPANLDNQLQCVGALRRVYMLSLKGEYDPNLLDLSLRALINAWGRDSQATQAVMVEGMALFLAKNMANVDYARVWTKLKEYSGGAQGLHAKARANAANRGMRMPHSVADLITDAYNKGLNSRKMPVWVGR
jgi:hypothetical protein